MMTVTIMTTIMIVMNERRFNNVRKSSALLEMPVLRSVKYDYGGKNSNCDKVEKMQRVREAGRA